MDTLVNSILNEQDIRQSLIEYKNTLTDDIEIKNNTLYHKLIDLLNHDDPKVRKNTALILGHFHKSDVKYVLLTAYKNETIDYVKESYLKALSLHNCKSILDDLKKIQQELLSQENTKHVQAQLKILNPLIRSYAFHKKKMVKLLHRDVDVILTTLPYYQFTIFDYVLDYKYKPVGQGVLVRTKSVHDLLPIRNYKDMIIPLKNCSMMEKDAGVIAHRIADSNIIDILENLFDHTESFYYKITDNLREKDAQLSYGIIKGLFEIFPTRLLNTTHNYEIEIVLKELKKDKVNAYLKLSQIDNPRFAYRKEIISNSMQPYVAATLLEVAKPYMSDHARVLDPFVGSGVTLIERCMMKKTRFAMGLDIYSKGLEAAKRNAKAADVDIHFINKDALRFVNNDMFDEIITDMPTFAQMKDKEQLTRLYDRFFKRIHKHVKPGGYVFIYTSEIALVEKNLRLQRDYLKLIEHNDVPRGKHMHYFFIIQVK